MIHYHGLPITPLTAAVKAINAGHAFVSFKYRDQLSAAVEVCQSFAVDNGAFSSWKSGNPITDWSEFYRWVETCLRYPSCDFAVIPDVIDGNEDDNDLLLMQWPFRLDQGAPVWHMHESLERLERLVSTWPRVCLGSSGDFATVGDSKWWVRISEVMGIACDANGYPRCKLHGLRMLNPRVFSKLPFSSADSTNIGRNVGIDKNWANGNYLPMTKEARAQVMRDRIEFHNGSEKWTSHRGV